MKIDYGIFFTKNDQVIRLPHNPEKLPVTLDNDNEDENVLGIGPITMPRIPKQKEITISDYFPGKPDRFTVTPNSFLEPEFYINFFTTAMMEKEILTYTPVRYYEDGTPFFTSDEGFQCLVTEFSYEERGGETGDFYYDLTFIEWRDYSPIEVVVETQEDGTTVATEEPARETPQGELVVGATVIANGPYYYTSYQDEPHGEGNGRRAVISRIISDDPTRPCKIHITTESGGALGWITADQLQVVSE